MKKVKQFVLIIILLVASVGGLFLNRVWIQDVVKEFIKPPLPKTVSYQTVIEQKVKTIDTPSSSVSSTPILSQPNPPSFVPEINLLVPFTMQSPDGKWDEIAEESCEEASLLMVKSFYEGVTDEIISPDDAKKDILKIVEFEMQTFGFFEDTTVDQAAMIAEQFFGYPQSDVLKNPTVDQIKLALENGYPVIVPAAGRLLNNPYFKSPGPEYHMLVIRGYTKDDQFIVNDPGTKRGQSYLYPFETVMNAIHDWNSGGKIEEGQKVVLIIYPN